MSIFNTIKAPNILLPNKNVDLAKYAVIACDQFTSNLNYWKRLEDYVKDAPSTLKMMFPEAYLGRVDEKKFIDNINSTINSYLDDGTLLELGSCFILVERKTSVVERRLGLMIAIDLEDYTYEKGIKSPIRASEATIVERIPPRLKIRVDAPLEMPHILFLFDDKKKEIIEKLYEKRSLFPIVYDFELNMDGGHIKGYKIDDVAPIIEQFRRLKNSSDDGLLFIVGDGNHSLATAKAHWDLIKKNLNENERQNHPARYALVEALNIYDEGLIFEPIHRVMFDASRDFIDGLKKVLNGEYQSYIFYDNHKETIMMPSNSPEAYKVVQNYIDEYLKTHPNSSVDYIHDENELLDIAKQNKNAIAIKMPSLTKGDIFDYIAKDDVLPRKSFSMGHATEKRYYLEAKRIK